MADVLTIETDDRPVVDQIREAVRGGAGAVQRLMERWKREMETEGRPPEEIADVPGVVRWVDEIEAHVYFLAREGRVIYVGQTVQPIHNRIRQHRFMDFDQVWVLRVPIEELDDIEREFIRRLQPEQNARDW